MGFGWQELVMRNSLPDLEAARRRESASKQRGRAGGKGLQGTTSVYAAVIRQIVLALTVLACTAGCAIKAYDGPEAADTQTCVLHGDPGLKIDEIDGG